MRVYIKHNSKDYILGGIKLWTYKLFFRTSKTRVSLSLLLLITVLTLSLFSKSAAIIFTGFIFVIVLVDFVIYFKNVLREKRRVDHYISDSGSDVEIVHDEFFAYRQDDRNFQISHWDDIHEIYGIDDPLMISFKDRRTKNVIILYESEIGKGFDLIRSVILKKSKVESVV